MKKVTKTQTARVHKKLEVDINSVSIDTLQKGINVELEHGKRHGKTNVTNDSITLSATIALAHLEEFPDYYEALEKMEEKLRKKWKGKLKPKIFL
jgi:hypothetical protein